MTIEYKRSLTELNVILNYMNIKLFKKIPTSFIDFINKNMDKDYTPNIDKNIPLDQQNLNKDTKILLSLMYRNYWCDNKIKEELLSQDLIAERNHNQEMFEKYNPDNLFKNSVKKEIPISETTPNLVEYKPQNIIQKLFAKIKNLFFKK